MGLKISLFKEDKNCTDIGTFNVAHMTNFSKNEWSYHFIFEDQLINACTMLIKNKISFSTDGFNLTIKEDSNINIRVDAQTK